MTNELKVFEKTRELDMEFDKQKELEEDKEKEDEELGEKTLLKDRKDTRDAELGLAFDAFPADAAANGDRLLKRLAREGGPA
mgnify:CR=1 FL=1